MKVKIQIVKRSQGCCEHVDPITHERCNSKVGLEYDHYPKPFAMGGVSTGENLRQVCRAHNQLNAVKTYGREKVKVYRGQGELSFGFPRAAK